MPKITIRHGSKDCLPSDNMKFLKVGRLVDSGASVACEVSYCYPVFKIGIMQDTIGNCWFFQILPSL